MLKQASCVVVAAMAIAPAIGQTITYHSQTRVVSGFGSETGQMFDQAFDFDPAALEVEADNVVHGGISFVRSSQDSTLGNDTITLESRTDCEASGLYSFGDGRFDVTFSLDAPSRVHLDGVVEALWSGVGAAGGASLFIADMSDPGHNIAVWIADPQTPGVVESVDVDLVIDLDAGTYQLVAHNSASTFIEPTQAYGAVNVTMTASEPDCLADWNADSLVNSGDFLAYLTDYNYVRVGAPFIYRDPDLAAPFGSLNTQDFLAFLNIYTVGCP